MRYDEDRDQLFWDIPWGRLKRILVVALALLPVVLFALKSLGWFDYASVVAVVNHVHLQMWTSSPCPHLGEKVHLRARVSNDGDTKETFDLEGEPVLDMWVSQADTRIAWSDGKPLTAELTHLELRPGESKTIEMYWTPTMAGFGGATAVLRFGNRPGWNAWTGVPAGGCSGFLGP